MRFLVIEGTVRKGRKSIHAASYLTELLGDKGHSAELFDMKEKDVPLLENRRYKEGDTPEDVEFFAKKVEESDGIVIVTPEYNHSIPGALKNLLDYLYPEYEDKPFSFVTVSGGGFGGVRAMEDLRLLTVTLKAHPGPGLPVSRVGEVFDSEGEIVDDEYVDRFEGFAEDVAAHTERFS